MMISVLIVFLFKLYEKFISQLTTLIHTMQNTVDCKEEMAIIKKFYSKTMIGQRKARRPDLAYKTHFCSKNFSRINKIVLCTNVMPKKLPYKITSVN